MTTPQQTGMVVRPSNGSIARQEFGAQQTQALAETASSAVATQARAAIESRYVMAMRNPRDMDQVRVRLLKECARPAFAQTAIYKKPVGKGVEGLSIRFVEAALRAMGNVLPESIVIYDDAEKRIVRVQVTDLENNLTYSRDVVIEKTVERKHPKEGQTILGRRVNSTGEMTYLVDAGEDELTNKQMAQESKTIRALGLRFVPGDLQDECEAAVRALIAKKVKEDPDAERKRIMDGFAELNIEPRHLTEYLGHELAVTTPAELAELRNLWVALRDGEATWEAAMEHRSVQRSESTKPEAAPTAKGAAAAKERIAKRRPAPAVERAATAEPEPAKAPEAEAPKEETKAAAPPDELEGELRFLYTSLEKIGLTPGELPTLKARIDKLPPCPDKDTLLRMSIAAARMIEAERGGKGGGE